MGGVGIVGTGISGVQLALYLQAQGVDTVLYAAQTADAQRAGRLPNTVMRWGPTIEREERLGVAHWPDNEVPAGHVRVGTDLSFTGRLARPANTTDFRIYVPRLMDDYEERGGRVEVGERTPDDLPALAAAHDLVVVAAGRNGFGGTFPRDPSRSPYATSPRSITVGLFRGAAWPEPPGVEFNIIPGVGEIFQISFHSFDGPISAIAIEALPDGPLAGVVDTEAVDGAIERAMLDATEVFAPSIRERIDGNEFALARPEDLLQGRLIPVVRRNWVPVADGRFAIAIGDAWILNDPIAAQGANLGSRCAFVLGAAIARGGPYDERFCRRAEHELWTIAQPPTILTNALLAPPAAHVIDILGRATQEQELADRFVSGFGDPEAMLELLAPPDASQGANQAVG
jgi:2-polyprenyl-6-methoxyphenol hydroxylase-like FAD-dependent oxidoreductase